MLPSNPKEKTRKLPSTRRNLYEIITQLENPQVRLEDNTAYQIDAETLGILYAYAVSAAPPGLSPARMDADHSLRSDVVQELKRQFQRWTRNFLYARLGELVWRKSTAAELTEKYRPNSFPGPYAAETVESLVSSLAQQGEFSKIGERVKEGAGDYHQEVVRRRMSNYRYSVEYNAVVQALKR